MTEDCIVLRQQTRNCPENSRSPRTWQNRVIAVSRWCCRSMMFHIAIYQPVVMPYQARCCGVLAEWQATFQGRRRSIIW